MSLWKNKPKQKGQIRVKKGEKMENTTKKTALEEIQELLKSPNIRDGAEKLKMLGLTLIAVSRLIEETNNMEGN